MLDSKPPALPNRRPDRMWGGAACGSKCAICGLSLTRDGVELEIEFNQAGDLGPDTYHVHVPCFVTWERTLVEADRTRDDRNEGQHCPRQMETGESPVLTRAVIDGMITDGDGCADASRRGPA